MGESAEDFEKLLEKAHLFGSRQFLATTTMLFLDYILQSFIGEICLDLESTVAFASCDYGQGVKT